MHSLIKGLGACAIGLLAALMLLAPPNIQGSEMDLSTTFSVNQPFMVPGKVLDANTKYVMRLLDTPGSRRVVTVYNQDESQLQAMFIALPDYRREPTDKTVITFMETDQGYPKPIQTWFYPGRTSGLEFVYPKDQALEITAHSGGKSLPINTGVARNEPVANDTPIAQNEPVSQGGDLSDQDLIAQNEQPSDLKAESNEVIREKPAETTPEPAVEAPPSATPQQSERENAAGELPRTAGELPLLGLVGTLSLGLGFAVRLFSVR